MFDCKWGPFRCWGDKFLGNYENDRYIVVCIGKLGFHWQIQTTKENDGFEFVVRAGWSSVGFYSRIKLYKWEFSKMIFWIRGV